MFPRIPLTLETFLKATSDLYLILDSQLVIKYASAPYLMSTFTQLSAILNRNISDIFSSSLENNQIALQNFSASFKRVLINKLPDSMEIQRFDIPLPDGGFEERYWSTRNLPIVDEDNNLIYIIHRVEDVTSFILDKKFSEGSDELQKNEYYRRQQEFVQARKRLDEVDQRLRLLINESRDYAFIVLDTKGYIQSWNKGAKRIKGYNAEEIIGKHFSVFYTPEDIAKHHPENELQVALEHGRYEERSWRVRKNGTRFWANVIITPLYNSQGKLEGYGKVTRDLTDKKYSEDQRKELIKVLDEEMRHLLQLIKKDLSDAKISINQQKNTAITFLANAQKNTNNLSKLCQKIITLENIELDNFTLSPKHVRISEVIKQAVKDVSSLLVDQNVKIKYEISDDYTLDLDSTLLQEVLCCLLVNSLQISSEDIYLQASIEGTRFILSAKIKAATLLPIDVIDGDLTKISQIELTYCQVCIKKLGGILQLQPSWETFFIIELPYEGNRY